MLRFGSLRTRIVVYTTVPLIAILVVTLWTTMHAASGTVRRSVHQSLIEAGSVFVQMLSTQKNELTGMAQVTVRDPRFFATFSIPPSERGAEFRPTLEGIALDFLRITDADFLEIYDPEGRFIASVDIEGPRSDDKSSDYGRDGLKRAMRGAVVADFYEGRNGLIAAAVAPVYAAQRLEAILRLGRHLDDEFVQEVKRLTGADVCLARGGRGLTSTFPGGISGAWPGRSSATTLARESITLGDALSIERESQEFLASHIRVDGVSEEGGFDVIIGQEIEAAMTPLIFMERRVIVGGIVAVLVTLIVAYLIANSITRPLSRIVDASNALKDGQYEYPVDVEGRDEVAHLGRNFKDMRRSLKDYVQHLKNLDEAKSNFIALAGHELRTPLTIISGFNDMIVSGALGDVPDKVHETTQVINDQLSDLNRLVQTMLDLTYLEQGLQSMHIITVDLDDVVRSALERRRDVITQRDLRLETHFSASSSRTLIDAERISDAFLQLLDNAIRYTPDGGTIGVTTTEDDSNHYIVVEDTGVGIPPSELKRIFDKIYEVGDIMKHSSGKHDFGSRGFGLGLALCKAIVEAHDGTIHVDSAPGRGSRFTIELPHVTHPATGPTGRKPEGVLV